MPQCGLSGMLAGMDPSVPSGSHHPELSHDHDGRIRPLTVHAARLEVTAPGWDGPLEAAAGAALALVPALTGRTLILVDRSASMFTQVARGSAATVADQAAVFGACLALDLRARARGGLPRRS
jgi:hypothetical protein